MSVRESGDSEVRDESDEHHKKGDVSKLNKLNPRVTTEGEAETGSVKKSILGNGCFRHISGSSSRSRTTSSSSSSSSSDETSILQSPDGGWGWMVVVASFTANMIVDGLCFGFGILFTEFLEIFGESKFKTAWIGSLFVSMPAICGPIASIVTNMYGCKRTTIAGGLIAAVGCFLSFFANTVDMLCITFGVIAGFGLSLVCVPAVIIVAFYFEKKRAFATGLAVSGSGIGTFVFAPLIELLLEEYTWRGTMLIMSGLMLNIVVCGDRKSVV